MTSKQNEQNAGTQETALGAAGATDSSENNGKAPQALDRWFDDQLNQLFNDVSTEPLPPDLAKLIGQLRSQGQK